MENEGFRRRKERRTKNSKSGEAVPEITLVPKTRTLKCNGNLSSCYGHDASA
jgi:hypothetical protein